MVQVRLDWLATQAPGAPGIEGYAASATALYQQSLATPTPPATATPNTAEAAAATDEIAITMEASGAYDLISILAQAQSAAALTAPCGGRRRDNEIRAGGGCPLTRR